MTTVPTVSVIIPHYSDLVRLDRCLAAVEAQTYPRASFEVVVADNDSPEGQAAVEATIAGRAKLVIVKERGAGAARNGGFSVSQNSVLAFTDSDCLPDRDWIAQGVAALSQFDLVGGRMNVDVSDPRRRSAVESFESVFAFDNERYVSRKGFSVTANLFCTRSVFFEVGNFRARVSEDMDWSHRATAAGFRIGYAPAAVVSHPARRTWSELKQKFGRIDSETFALFRSKGGRNVIWFFRCWAQLALAVLESPKAMTSRNLYSLRQRFEALSILYRLRMWRLVDCLALLAVGRS